MLRAKPKTERKKVASREPTYVGEHLVVDPRVCHGKMTFRGTRVPVETILVYLANGHSLEYLHKSWPEVSAEAIGEAVRMAADTFFECHEFKRL
jgi:uncharacterized protein (DUF433 family)